MVYYAYNYNHTASPAFTPTPIIVSQMGGADDLTGRNMDNEHEKYGISRDTLAALKQAQVNVNTLTRGQLQYAEMDHYFDNELDDNYINGDADMFLTPVKVKEKGAWTAREEARRSTASEDILYTSA